MLIVLFAESPYFIGNQFGFREENSTEVALIFLTDKVRQAIDNGNLAGAWFIDLSMFVIHSGKEKARPAVSTTNSNYYIASYIRQKRRTHHVRRAMPVFLYLACSPRASMPHHHFLFISPIPPQRTPSAVDAIEACFGCIAAATREQARTSPHAKGTAPHHP